MTSRLQLPARTDDDVLFTPHTRDCAPCDAARAVHDVLAHHFDPNDTWPDVDVDGVTEDQRITGLIAEVLHRYRLGGRDG